jgi:hypothetical protein
LGELSFPTSADERAGNGQYETQGRVT